MADTALDLTNTATKLVECAEQMYRLHDIVSGESAAQLNTAFQSNAGDALSKEYKQLGEEIKATGDIITAVAERLQKNSRRTLLMNESEGD